ncbi:hypothetical protein [Xenorhabdus sp. Sc-CR9]|uniref:hypothetical protein n=1 Tax=Xenorhabdus sp. Sc-CR9 TaxID=2584468 RepID=UPI001F2C7B62|nr:hypothetical protein [Xenorhabdus sp. Sc-CR9]
MTDNDYWEGVISEAAEECNLELTNEQLIVLIKAVRLGAVYWGNVFDVRSKSCW